MSETSATVAEPTTPYDPMNPPNHLQLPDKDGSFVTNYQEHPQSSLLTTSLTPRILEVQPDGQFSIGTDNGIYWRRTEPALAGCKAPDWFLVLGVPPMLNGELRRSYVLWEEGPAPFLIIEYVSGDGGEEHDTTPNTGKMWVYEQGIRAPFYAIFDGFRGTLEVHHLIDGVYVRLEPNARDRYPIERLRIELGLWEGTHWMQSGCWLRAWDTTSGELLPSAEEFGTREKERADTAEELLDDARERLEGETERAEAERKRAENEKQRAENEKQRAENEKQRADVQATRAEALAARLRALGIDPDAA